MTVPRVRHDRLTVLATVLLVAVLVAACNSATPTPSPEASPTAAPPSAAPSPTPSEAPAAAPSSVPTAADPIYDEIEQEVAALRGLQPTGDVARTTLDEAQLAEEMEKLYHEESPPELVAANERFYKALGLLPTDASLGDLTVEMLSGGVAGYYRDDQKTLYVVSRSGEVGPNEKVTFAHEFDHALQDQHFTIFKDQEGVTNRSDWLLARQALYEGDASLLMTLWMSENFAPEEFQELLAQGLNDPSSANARADAGDPARDVALPVHDRPDVRPGPVRQWRRLGRGRRAVRQRSRDHGANPPSGEVPGRRGSGRDRRPRRFCDADRSRLGPGARRHLRRVPDRRLAARRRSGECHRGGRGLGRGPGARARRPGRRMGDRAGHGMGYRGGRSGVRGVGRPRGRGARRSSRAASRRDGHRPLGRGREQRRRARGGRRVARPARVRSPRRDPTSRPARRSPTTQARWRG